MLHAADGSVAPASAKGEATVIPTDKRRPGLLFGSRWRRFLVHGSRWHRVHLLRTADTVAISAAPSGLEANVMEGGGYPQAA